MMRWLLTRAAPMVLGVVLLTAPVRAADWHVTPGGSPTGRGTEDAPWDLASALGGSQKIAPGDMIWFHAGRYHAGPQFGGRDYEVRLVGREGRPVRMRAV